MQRLLILLFAVTSLTATGQTVKEMSPEPGALIDKSPEGEIEFNKLQKKYEELWNKVATPADYDKLSAQDKKLYDSYTGEEEQGYWDILGSGCSWYCGGGLDTATASSALTASGQLTYTAGNSHDLSYKTAWVEGVPGYGIGEYLEYHFPPENPRITDIIIVNGYVKSERAWKDNSRVKKLKMYLNGKPFAILNLADTREEQTFTFSPIGNGDRDDMEKLSTLPWWTMKFEIMEVYKGDKYDDTAITEIYFNGIDVH